MDTYNTIETYQDSIELVKLIHSVFHLKYGDKQGAMASVETDN